MIDSNCLPKSSGALQASAVQAGSNLRHMGNPAADTADFNDDFAGNLRLDYLLPSRGLVIRDCGVFWPTTGDSSGEDSNRLADVSDHHLVWLDISL
jgi:alkaline phosphatase D